MEVSSRWFRDNQRAVFDLADKGEQVVINRGKKRSYILTPIEEGDIEKELSPALMEAIERGLESIRKGEGHEYTSMADLRKRLGL